MSLYSRVGGPIILSGYSMPQSGGGLKATSSTRVTREPLRVGVILAEHFTLSAFAVFIVLGVIDIARGRWKAG